MVGNGLCKFRKNIMKIFIHIFAILILVSCSNEQPTFIEQTIEKDKKYDWRLVTSWPKNLLKLGLVFHFMNFKM